MSKKVTLLPQQVEAYEKELAELNKQMEGLTTEKKSISFYKACNGECGTFSNDSLDSSLLIELSIKANRIKEIKTILANAEILDVNANKGDTIAIGTTFSFKTDRIQNMMLTLVEVNGNPAEGLIAIDSPIGAAVLDKTVGDEFSYTLPNGNIVNGSIIAIHNLEKDAEKKNILM